MQGLNFLTQLQPFAQNQTLGALAALNPANRQARAEQFRRNAMAQSRANAEQMAMGLGPQGNILADSLRAGAINEANRAANEFMFGQYSPEQDVQAALLAAQLMQPEVASPLLNEYMGLLDNMRAAHAATPRRGSFLNNLVGVAGSLAGMGWNPFARASGGGAK